MKKILAGIVLLTILTQAQAQYKKATFFSKPGRYLEVGGFMPVLKDGRSGGTGIYLSFGGINPGGHLTFGYDLGAVLPIKFNYTADAYTTGATATKVSGKSKTGFLFRYNIGYVFGNTALEGGSRILPFISGNLGIVYGSEEAAYTTSPPGSYLSNSPVTGIPALLYGGSAGLFIKATKRFGLQVSGGYNGLNGFDSGGSTYKALPSHFFYSAGLRLLLGGEKE